MICATQVGRLQGHFLSGNFKHDSHSVAETLPSAGGTSSAGISQCSVAAIVFRTCTFCVSIGVVLEQNADPAELVF